ncbi:MAG: chorismate lyase [Pseudomonadota bacterium]|nr:chorismate lyase [Pseudomonadota bacterium]
MIHTPSLAATLHPASPLWSARCHCIAPVIPAPWRTWLFDQGSLTARLTALAPGFRVEATREYFGRPTPVERRELHLGVRETVWVREVTLYLGDIAVVHARTAVPVQALRGKLRCLQALGNRSLGSFLFRQPDLKRNALTVSHCAPGSLGVTWARRSVFRVSDQPLMVSEAFCPALLEFPITGR